MVPSTHSGVLGFPYQGILGAGEVEDSRPDQQGETKLYFADERLKRIFGGAPDGRERLGSDLFRGPLKRLPVEYVVLGGAHGSDKRTPALEPTDYADLR